MAKAKILIADDHALMRIGLMSMLELQPDMTVIAEAGTGAAAIELAAKLHPDVVIIDLRMPDIDGAEATRQILSADPTTKVIVLTSFGMSVEMARALEYGATGAQLKESPTAELLDTIRKVVAGERNVPLEITQWMESYGQRLITDRQVDVLNAVARGMSGKEIAHHLGISRTAVQKHLAAIFEKFGVSNRAQAVARALSLRLIGPDMNPDPVRT